jgi:hypothetical protein
MSRTKAVSVASAPLPTGATAISTASSSPFARRTTVSVVRPCGSAVRLACGSSDGGNGAPTASRAPIPNVASASPFHSSTRPAASMVTMASRVVAMSWRRRASDFRRACSVRARVMASPTMLAVERRKASS